MARPTDGLGHVDRLPGDASDKRRLRTILHALQGECTVAEACAELGIGEARFHVLRKQALAGALAALAPRPPGRPKRVSEVDPEVEALRTKILELRIALHAAEIREELAMTIPHVLRRKKNLRGKPRSRSKA